MKAVVLFSGGLDSTTALYQAMADRSTKTLAVNFSYGQTHNFMENNAAQKISEAKGVRMATFQIPADIFKGGRSSLMGEQPIPNDIYEVDKPSSTFVPNRNAVLISSAVAIAQARGYDKVYMGMHASDHEGWAYPDCSPEFLGAMANAVWVASMGEVRLVFPFIWMTKAEIVERAAQLHVPAQWTWSCYKGGQRHCGSCPTCRERINAFVLAGYVDPVPYNATIGWANGKGWPVEV